MTKKQETQKPVPTDYCCPVCDKPLFRQYGNQMYPGNKDYGVTLFCVNGDPNARAHPQEISGHGNGRSDESMLKNAYAVIRSKLCGAKLETEGELVDIDAGVTLTDDDIKVTSAHIEEIRKGKRKVKTAVPVVEDEAI